MSNPYETAKRRGSVLGSTLRFKGKLSADEDLLIQGHVEGSIKHTSNLTIGEEGRIKGNVRAEYIVVEGSVNGDLSGDKSVIVRNSANVDGNIYSPVVTLLEGAKFNGSIDMSGKSAADQKPKPEKAREERPTAPAADGEPEVARSSGRRKTQRSEKKSASAA